jgi:prevent-host-death family protein
MQPAKREQRIAVAISKTELASNTRKIVEQVRHGQTIVVQSHGEDQIVLLDALDYRLLKVGGRLCPLAGVRPDQR